ncbi:nuclear transport factor 2 family protein [Candidatus Nitrosotenuis cloacae]|uniref:nuclear transport factor 2 family protein n=1 Tax=Candidatus Nitrosotenuis cloacae TaxID=1603555 RepID=UPI00227F27CE|nr:nuclear transport factor 2 family protein [Candidatus Nitrosotenuis cloacae]
MDSLDLIREFYSAFKAKDSQAYVGMCDDNIEWTVMDGMPSGGTFVGKKAVFEGYFPSMLSNFSDFHAVADEFLAADGGAIVLGRYIGTAKNTGKKFESRFAHVYVVSGGKITKFRQYADTHKIQNAIRRE